jgi:hypothetical protein
MAEAQCFSVVQHPHYILLRHGAWEVWSMNNLLMKSKSGHVSRMYHFSSFSPKKEKKASLLDMKGRKKSLEFNCSHEIGRNCWTGKAVSWKVGRRVWSLTVIMKLEEIVEPEKWWFVIFEGFVNFTEWGHSH